MESLDETQVKYKRLYNYEDSDLVYRNFIVKYTKYESGKRILKVVINACCKEHAIYNSPSNVVSIKDSLQ